MRAAMSRKILADTNILIDIAQPDRPGHAAGLMLLDEVAYHEVELCVASSSLKDVYYILCKCSAETNARHYITQAIDVFTVLPVDESVCKIAANSDEPDFEDGIIRACAELAKVDFILSRDQAAFSKSPIKRLNAQDYLDLFCNVKTVELTSE